MASSRNGNPTRPAVREAGAHFESGTQALAPSNRSHRFFLFFFFLQTSVCRPPPPPLSLSSLPPPSPSASTNPKHTHSHSSPSPVSHTHDKKHQAPPLPRTASSPERKKGRLRRRRSSPRRSPVPWLGRAPPRGARLQLVPRPSAPLPAPFRRRRERPISRRCSAPGLCSWPSPSSSSCRCSSSLRPSSRLASRWARASSSLHPRRYGAPKPTQLIC